MSVINGITRMSDSVTGYLKLILFTGLLLSGLTFTQLSYAEPIMVDTEWLAENLTDKQLVVVDMSGDPLQYTRFHIPGAVRLSYEELLRVRKPDRVKLQIPNEHFYRILGKLGITRNTYVVIYDDMGGLNAGRLFWQLEQIGHPRVSVLNGGLVAWIQEGRQISGKPVKPVAMKYEPSNTFRENSIAYPAVREQIKTDQSVFLDVRTREEYQGSVKIKRSGHIPGAIWWPWENSISLDKGFKHRSVDELQAELSRVGVTPKKPLVLYCRTGHRASQTYLTLRALGFTRLQIYDGSMAEYTQHRDAPMMKGAH